MAKQNDDSIFQIDDLLFGDSEVEAAHVNVAPTEDSSSNSTKKTSRKKKSASATEEDKFSHVHEQQAAAPHENTEAFNVVGVGLYSRKYKILVTSLMIVLAAAVGALCLLLGSIIGKFVELNWFYVKNVAPFIPAFNVVVMALYYVIFAVRPYNYDKNGAVSQMPTSEDRTYRKMHSVYYTTRRALFVLLLLAVLNVTLMISANFLYGVIANG